MPVVTPVISLTGRKVSLCNVLVVAVRLTEFITRYNIIISVIVVPELVMVYTIIVCIATVICPVPLAVKGYTVIPVAVIIVVHKRTWGTYFKVANASPVVITVSAWQISG